MHRRAAWRPTPGHLYEASPVKRFLQTAGRHPSGEGQALSRYCAGHWAACAVFWAGAPSRQCRAASISASVAP
jgi:hypothetical protein